MRSLGLYVDGPVRWGVPEPSRVPGIFVIELPGGGDELPIDSLAVKRWIERVPRMTIDGEPATVSTMMQRLRMFWLPSEPIVYVGRSAKTLGGRLAAIYATPLGDARPSSAAHWLKTLSAQPRLRVWWSETDAHEEYEDALLSEVATRNDGALPFANHATSGGERRVDGFAQSLLAEADTPPSSALAGRRKVPTRSTAGARKPAAPRARKVVAGKPAAEPTYVSAEGLENLTTELEQLRMVTRPEVITRVAAARALGDLRENADYEYARKEQSFVEGRIQALEQMLKTSSIIEAPAAGDRAHLGSTVVVETDGVEATYLLVGPTEADPAAGKISYVSPVGRALMGARADDEVSVELPSTRVLYRVREVR
ncbi:hypothetical protein BH23CHL7_BH23CHL7_00950 [soil metagenome]